MWATAPSQPSAVCQCGQDKEDGQDHKLTETPLSYILTSGYTPLRNCPSPSCPLPPCRSLKTKGASPTGSSPPKAFCSDMGSKAQRLRLSGIGRDIYRCQNIPKEVGAGFSVLMIRRCLMGLSSRHQRNLLTGKQLADSISNNTVSSCTDICSLQTRIFTQTLFGLTLSLSILPKTHTLSPTQSPSFLKTESKVLPWTLQYWGSRVLLV